MDGDKTKTPDDLSITRGLVKIRQHLLSHL